jgi:hypothetical protein
MFLILNVFLAYQYVNLALLEVIVMYVKALTEISPIVLVLSELMMLEKMIA